MTALNFVLLPENLTLVTDTLCTAGPTRAPYIYSSKIHVAPHLHGALAMKGDGMFALKCYIALLTRLIAKDMIDVDKDIAPIYRQVWEEHCDVCRASGVGEAALHATIYHFGWCQGEGRMVAFEYSTANDFRSERIKDGAWLHPNTVADIVVTHPDDLLRITRRQKKIDDALPQEKRAGIGGDFHRLFISSDGIGIQRVYRSSDFDKIYKQMENFSEEDGWTQSV